MIFYQTLDGRLEDLAEAEALCLGSLCQLVAKMPGDAAYTRDGHGSQTIGTDVVSEEIAEIVDHDLLHGLVGQVAMDERGERGQEAIGHRFTIDTLDDIGHIQAILTFKLFANIIRQNTFIQLMQKMLSKHPSTTLIAEDITQGWRILDDGLSAIKARISARS